MTDSHAKYRAIPSSTYQSNARAHDAGVSSGDESELYSTTEHIPVKARTRWTYFLLGCTILLPWNALLNATSFFLSRLAGSTFYPTFSSYLFSLFTLTKLAFQFYCTFTSKQSSPSRRIFASITALILLVTSLCFSTFIRGTPSTFFAFTLINAVTMAVAIGYLSTGIFAGAALLGTPFLQAVLSGQAAIGVAVSAVQVAGSMIALWASSPKPASMKFTRAGDRDDQAEEIAARIFFGVSAVFLGIVLIAYTWLTRQSFYKSITSALEQHRRVGDPDERTRLVADDRRNSSTEPNSHVYRVFRQNFIFMFSLAYVFAVTMAVYPAITARVRSVNLGIHPLLFTAVHFLVYNIGDLLGRNSYSFPYLLVWSGKKILAMSLLRTLFIPLILLCNINRPATTPLVLPMIHSDVLFMIIMLTMGYTAGYVVSLSLLAASSLEHNPRLKGRREDVDVVATLGGSFVVLGLALGALCSFGVQALI